MQKPYQHNHCHACQNLIGLNDLRARIDDKTYCVPCYEEVRKTGEKLMDIRNNKSLPLSVGFNKPEHYHNHQIDTIRFLQKGFPPDVFEGFAIGHIIKYIQRYQYKGGREDLVKAADYANRLLDWHDKTHS